MSLATALEPNPTSHPSPAPGFGDRADDATIERTADALKAKRYTVHVVEDGDAAARSSSTSSRGRGGRQGASQTLEVIGITKELEESGRYDAVRKHTDRWIATRRRASGRCASSRRA